MKTNIGVKFTVSFGFNALKLQVDPLYQILSVS